MQVSDLIQQYNNNLSAGSEISTGTKGVEQLTDTISKLTKGQIFEGSITDVSGDKVTISFSNGQSINARLDGTVTVNAGESLFFEVKSNDGTTVQIRPFSGENNINPTLLQALSNASLPVNEKNLNLVNSMISENMAIDSDSMTKMSRAVASFPSVDTADLLQMNKMNIPLTHDMVEAFENYKSNESAILDSVDLFTSAMSELSESNNVDITSLIGFQQKLIAVITSDSGLETSNMALNSTSQSIEENTGSFIEENTGSIIEENTGSFTDENIVLQNEENLTVPLAEKGSNLTEENVQVFSENNIVNTKEENTLLSNTDYANPSMPEEKSSVTLKTVLGNEGLSQLNNLLNEIKDSLNLTENNNSNLKNLFDENGILKPEVDINDFLKAFSDSLSDSNLTKEDLLKLTSSKEYKEVITSAMKEQWTLRPEEVASSDNKVSKLYEKLLTQVELLDNIAKEATQNSDNSFSKVANNVRSNVEFMNQINMTYTYVQLPLKLTSENATGELYVYSNKKAKYKEGDELSAFLHFDLDNLGSTDISVKLKNRNVDTNFYMDNDEAYNLLKDNIHILEDRLKAKGYNCKITVGKNDDTDGASFVKMLTKEDVKPSGIIQRYSFDVRA